ncbi:TIGR03943 family putative permease subunit [Numidum massiliense]|uniref:TIGR03943 family putative permease subunit n=1 Tax=Numidum massiliense TaxID=1522315 RepID=UPI0006D58681|nr:TIGR03943 family protein [Numidum massiliense]
MGNFFQQLLKALILLSFAGFLFKLSYTGEISKYINSQFVTLSQLAALLLVFLFVIQLQRLFSGQREEGRQRQTTGACGVTDHGAVRSEDCSHHVRCDPHQAVNNAMEQEACCDADHGFSGKWSLKQFLSYVIIAIPLLTGFLLPIQTLNAEIATKKGMMPFAAQGQSADQGNGVGTQEEGDRPGENGTTEEGGGAASEEAGGTTAAEATDDLYTNNAIDAYDDEEAPGDEIIVDDGPDEYYGKMRDELKKQDVIVFTEEDFVQHYSVMSIYPDEFVGKKIKLTGFVYKEEGMAADELVVGRFAVTCCIADSSVLGFLSQIPEAQEIAADTWLEIEGSLETTFVDDVELPYVHVTEWREVEAPETPYVYPF